MFGFSDYFNGKKVNTGYVDADEEIRDWLSLLDMVLEHYLDAKTAGSEGLLFSRGLKMTEAETESYYFKKPAERVSIGFDEDFAGEVRKAFSYITAREESTTDETRLPLYEIAESMLLSQPARFALIVALSVQLDMKYTRLYGYISNDPAMQYPTVGVFLALYETFDQKGARSAVFDITDDAGFFKSLCLDRQALGDSIRPFLQTPLVLHPEILSTVLREDCGEEVFDRTGMPASYLELSKKLSQLFDEKPGRYYIECVDANDVHAVLSADENTPVSFIDLTKEGDDKEALQKSLIDAALSGGRVAVLCRDTDRLLPIKKELDLFPTVYIYGGDEMPDELLHETHGMMSTPVRLMLPDADERLFIWEERIKLEGVTTAEDVSIPAIADTYGFSYSRICEILRQVRLYLDTEYKNEINRAELLSIVFRYNAANFAGLATRVHTTYVWDDIEMAEAQEKRLLVACDRFRYRDRIDEKYGVAKRNAYGNGVSVLMYGAPGTGKTMAAQIVANELGLPLYRVDVSQIFSKYIGETEKNLGLIFDEATKANVILFFDEADALFAKRTDVGDSNDRYANAETAFLLQKIEAHNGMTILATNLYHNFDSAFVRRITYVVHIDSPDEATRLRLWKHTLPETCRFASDVDFDFLAENFELSGSNIKSILQTAAYMAGARDFSDKKGGAAITMADVIVSLRYELEKLGRIIDSTDFGNYGVYL